MKTRAMILMAAAGLVCTAQAATANPITVKWEGTNQGSNVKINITGRASDVFAGQLRHTFTNGSGFASGLNGTRRTFCADLDQHVGGTSTFTVVAPAQLSVRNAPLGQARADALADLFFSHYLTASDAAASNDLATAFQILVWEIIYDYDGLSTASIDLAAGDLRVTRTNGSALSAGVVAQFATLLTSVGSGVGVGAVGFYAVQSGTKQDQLLYVPGVIPAPGAAAALGLAGLVAARRRR